MGGLTETKLDDDAIDGVDDLVDQTLHKLKEIRSIHIQESVQGGRLDGQVQHVGDLLNLGGEARDGGGDLSRGGVLGNGGNSLVFEVIMLDNWSRCVKWLFRQEEDSFRGRRDILIWSVYCWTVSVSLLIVTVCSTVLTVPAKAPAARAKRETKEAFILID